jgi:hypothetical protein
MKSVIPRLAHSLFSASVPVATLLCMTAATGEANAAEKLFFASDVHEQYDYLQYGILSAPEVCGTAGACKVVGIVGDYSTLFPTTDYAVTATIGAIMAVTPISTKILARGNHEQNIASSPLLPSTGIAKSGAYYQIYVLNPADFGNAPTLMQNAVDCASNKVLVVMSHLPLHTTRTDPSTLTATNQQNLFNWLTTCAATRDIVYLWGHNHSQVQYDVGVDWVVLPGETVGTGAVILDYIEGVPLAFTYLNAGYVKPRGISSSSATTLTISNTSIVINRYGELAETRTLTR